MFSLGNVLKRKENRFLKNKLDTEISCNVRFFCQLNSLPKKCLPPIQSLHNLAYTLVIGCVATYYKGIRGCDLMWMLWRFRLQFYRTFPFFQLNTLPKSCLPPIQSLYNLAFMLPITSVTSCYKGIWGWGRVRIQQYIFHIFKKCSKIC